MQDAAHAAVRAAKGVAVREFQLKAGHGFADYLLYVDGQAAGVIEAKRAGETLAGVELQAEKYPAGLHDSLPAPIRPLPFLCQSTGVEARSTNGLEPDPRSRRVFSFFRPATRARPFRSSCRPLIGAAATRRSPIRRI